MSVKGTIKIDKYEAEFIDGEWVPIRLVDTVEEKNRITPNLIDYMRLGSLTGRNDMITAVSEAMYPGAMALQIDLANLGFTKGTIGQAATYNAGVEGGADSYWEIVSVVNPPGAGTRNIRTICLTSNSTSYDNKAWTIVNLPTPCTQTSTEILQITYRIVNDQSAIAALGTVNYRISEFIFQNNVHGGDARYQPTYQYYQVYDDTIWGNGIPEYHSQRALITNNASNQAEIYYDLLEREFDTDEVAQGLHSTRANWQLGVSNVSTNNDVLCGMAWKGVSFGTNDLWTGVAPLVENLESRVQNIFGRAASTAIADRRPFLDTNIIATSAADVNLIDKGDWIEHRSDSYLLPYMYRVYAVTGGNVGTATYKLKRRRIAHWERNRVEWTCYGIPFLHCGLTDGATAEEYLDVTTADTRKHGQTTWHNRIYSNNTNTTVSNSTNNGEAGTLFLRYVYPEFITFDYDGLTVGSIDQHKWTNLDANSAQAQAFTGILQVSTDGTDIYVADASQGLYQILRDHGDFNTTNWTVNKIGPPGITDDTSCRGVFHKGGTYWGGPGKIVDVNIVRGGSNYAVGNTITAAGANGTSFAANVARVDANGAIEAISITNRGSGYIEDHCQLYVSSGSGVGASLDPIIGAGGEMWAIFNDTTDSVCYLAKMTHILSTGTSYDFDNSNPYVITRSAGSFVTDGFRAGMVIHVKSAEDAANEGRYTIASMTPTALTVTEAITTNNTADTQAQIYAEKWEVMRETITTTESLTFADANPDTIVGTGGTTLEARGFTEGMEIVVSGSVSNNGTYTIADCTGNTITLDTADALVAEGPVSCTLATLTDFTITNYTSGSPGPVNFIGLVMDQEHADDRFAFLTPSTKYANDGITQQAVDNWTWWSFANSTGTTAAGSTDFTAVTGDSNSRALSGEQIGPLCIGPLSDGNTWVVHGIAYNSSARVDWGLTTLTGEGQDVLHRYIPHRCKTGFDIGVYGEGTVGTNNLKSNRVAADFTTSTQDSIISVRLDDVAFDNVVRYRPGYYGGDEVGLHGQLGHGMLMSRLNVDSNIRGGFLWTGNGDATLEGEDLMPYGYWEEFGWDGTRWVLDNASARTTHAQSSFSGTSLNINSTTGAIVGSGGGFTNWATDGFEAGDIITIATAENAANDGKYVIESLSGTTLTVTPDKLPATTNTDDTTATVVGDRAIIDGLALSFDDAATTAPLVLDEYYDCYVYDGIVKDNATSGTVVAYAPFMATKTGSDFESSTIPNSDVGQVFNEPITLAQKSSSLGTTSNDAGAYRYQLEPGVVGSMETNNGVDWIGFCEQQIPASTDFTFRFKLAGADANNPVIDVGVAPYSLAADGANYNDTFMDYNIRVKYDYSVNPVCDIYTIDVRNAGSGAVQSTYNADRVVLVEAQDETNYNGVGSNGTFIGGLGTAADTHQDGDIITMNDGTVVTVANPGGVDANGTIQAFDITTNSTKTSGNGQINAVSSSAGAGEIDFNTVGNIISRNAGGSFITDGFRIGMKIAVQGATTIGNDNAYTIQSVTASQIVTEENLNTTETNTNATIQHAIVQVASDGTGVNFALIPGTNNIQAADIANDEFALNRRGTTGDNLYWTLNGVEFYTHTGGPFNDQYAPCYTLQATEQVTMYDANIDYTIDRRYLKIGNGTTTGAEDTNFRCLPNVWAGSSNLQLFYNDGSGPVEFTYITDGRTAPASGEVTILPFSGRLWFNTAQAGDTLTGNWTITLKPNIE